MVDSGIVRYPYLTIKDMHKSFIGFRVDNARKPLKLFNMYEKGYLLVELKFCKDKTQREIIYGRLLDLGVRIV
jgi:hypothetical protein